MLIPDDILTRVGGRTPLADLKAQGLRTLSPRNVLEVEPAEMVERTTEHPLRGTDAVRGAVDGAEPLVKTLTRELRNRQRAKGGEEAHLYSEPWNLHWS